MLNQERVCEMTRLAIFDQKEGRKCKPMIQYFRKDYIAREILKSLITGTMAFFVLLLICGLYGSETLLNQINTIDIQKLIINVILCYAVFMGAYLGITYAIYYGRYTRGRQKVKKYYVHLKKVNRLYQQEEQM